MKSKITSFAAKYASMIIEAVALVVVIPASAGWVNQPQVPEELLK